MWQKTTCPSWLDYDHKLREEQTTKQCDICVQASTTCRCSLCGTHLVLIHCGQTTLKPKKWCSVRAAKTSVARKNVSMQHRVILIPPVSWIVTLLLLSVYKPTKHLVHICTCLKTFTVMHKSRMGSRNDHQVHSGSTSGNVLWIWACAAVCTCALTTLFKTPWSQMPVCWRIAYEHWNVRVHYLVYLSAGSLSAGALQFS